MQAVIINLRPGNIYIISPEVKVLPIGYKEVENMGHEKQVKYKLIYGDQKKINEELSPAETSWKPILMSAIADPPTPGGITFAVILERTATEY